MMLAHPLWPHGNDEMATLVRAFDWATTPLGPIEGWSERLKLMVEQVLASPRVSCLVCRSGHILIYNAAAARHFGDHHPAALGRPLPDTFPEGWATVAPYYARAFDGETVEVGSQPLDTRGEGTATDVLDAMLTPVRESDGSTAYVHMIGSEVGDRVRTEAVLRESEERYRTLFERLGQGFIELEVIRDEHYRPTDLHYLELNPAFERQFGVPVSQARGRRASEFFPGFDPSWTQAFDRVLQTGVPERIEQTLEGRWFEVFAYPAVGGRVMALYEDVSERKQAEQVLRESEKRQAYLLELSDALRPLADPAAIQGEATRQLLERLDLSRCLYSEFGDENFTVLKDAFRDGLPSLVGTHDFSDCPEYIAACLAGRLLAVPDIVTSPFFSERVKARYAPIGARAALLCPLVKDGELISVLSAFRDEARPWPEWEVGLVGEVAERTWAAVERARAEQKLRESEERFRQFARASAAGLWIRDAATLDMEFVSHAIGTIYGVAPDALAGDVKRWAATIVPEDREAMLKHLEAARAGDITVHEFRIQRPSDGAFRWIRNTDFPLRDGHGRVQRIGGIAEDVTETRRLTEHQGVLVAELQHRVRNIMGMIRSMANRTAPGASDIEEYRLLLEGRLLALARVQALLTREANAGGSLRSIIGNEVAAQAHHGGQYALTGPDIQLSPKAVEVLTLAFHELATNALKYGALSVPEGRLSVSWTLIERRGKPWLALDWIEEGAPSRESSTRRGFGSELIEARIPYELGGRGTITIVPEGARCQLEFPLKGGESILETDAPQPATIFGGTLDMTGAPDLTGRTVLVVEDDYFLATDTAKALRGAGATVLGPCPNEEATRDLLEDEVPTHAVLDLNLGGGGPRFEIAYLLKARGIPFVFLTGYDPDVIPADMADIVRLQKPLPFHRRSSWSALATDESAQE